MLNNFYPNLYSTILGTNTAVDGLLVVHAPDIGNQPDERERIGEYDPVAVARSVFPPTKETEVIDGEILDSLEMLREVVRQSSSSHILLLPSWGTIHSYQKNKRRELQEVIGAQYPIRGLTSFYELAIYDALQSMELGKNLLVLLPTSFLVNHQSGKMRTYLTSNHSLKWIVESDAWPFFPNVHHTFAVCSALIEAGQCKAHVTRMFRVPEVAEGKATELLKEVDKLRRQQGGRTTNGYILRETLPEDEAWSFGIFHPRWNEYLKDLSSLGGTLLLREIAEILTAHPRRYSNGKDKRKKARKAICISGRHITLSGQLIIERDNERPAYTDLFKLQPGDIVMRSLITPSHREFLPVARVPAEVEHSLYADRNIIVIRPRKDIDSIDPEWLLSFLQSSRAGDWIRSRLTSPILDPYLLQEMPVPIQDDDTVALWQQVEQLLDEMTGWKNRLERARRELFQYKTIREGHAALIATTLEAAQRAKAARETQYFSWKVRNLYPYPLAFRWREIETMENRYQKYQRVLDTAEILAAYLAVVALVMAENYGDGQMPGYLKTIKRRLSRRPKSGMSFGDWLALLTEISESKQYRSVGPGTPFFEIASFLSGETRQIFDSLKTARDDHAHGRGPSNAEIDRALAEVQANLVAAYRKAEFLTQYPLRFIEDSVYQVRQKATECVYRDLMGDHPLVPIERTVYTESINVQQDALYFASPDNSLYLIHPWLVRRMCPECGSNQIYVFDHLNSETGAVVVKGLECGHVIEADDLFQDLQQLGILPD